MLFLYLEGFKLDKKKKIEGKPKYRFIGRKKMKGKISLDILTEPVVF